MQHRGTRLAILCLFLAAGTVAAYFVWSAGQSLNRLDEQHEVKAATIDRLRSSISTIATAQQAYTDYGRRDLASFTRVSVQVDRITTDAAGLRAAANSTVSSERLEQFWTALSALMSAESRARERFAGGDESGAADAVLATARDHVTVLSSSLRAFEEAELESYRGTRASAIWRSGTMLGGVGALWAVGLIAFAVVPLRRRAAELPAAPQVVTEPMPDVVAAVPVAAVPSVDLATAATVCGELSRLTDQAALPGLLAKTADLLGARGIVIWIGAGGELFAVAAHGYDDAILARIRPIPRHADNATAEAWRSGELRRVPPDASGFGAIVVPLLSVSGCVGVLAAEVTGERERDDATHAVAAIVASQLAGVLAAWPVASTAEMDDRTLDRKAAAS